MTPALDHAGLRVGVASALKYRRADRHEVYNAGLRYRDEPTPEFWVTPRGSLVGELPELTLELMAQAESTLTESEKPKYIKALYEVTSSGMFSVRWQNQWPLTVATATQRATAFLTVKGESGKA